MNAKACFAAALLLIVSSPIAGGAVISRDWKTPGDELLTYDTVSGREWLDLPYTIEMFPVPLRDPEPRFQAVTQAIQPGGLLEGFVLAESSDLIGLAESAGIDVSTHDRETNFANTVALINALGRTDRLSSESSLYTRGLLNELEPTCNCRMYGNFGGGSGGAGVSLFSAAQNSDDIPSRVTGVWLYRQAVPEPTTLTPCAILVLLLSWRRTRSATSI